MPRHRLRVCRRIAFVCSLLLRKKKKKKLIVHSPTHRHCKLRVLAFTSFVRGIEENNSESILARFCFYVCRQLSRCTEKDSARSTISLDWKVYIRAGGCHSFGHHRHRRNRLTHPPLFEFFGDLHPHGRRAIFLERTPLRAKKSDYRTNFLLDRAPCHSRLRKQRASATASLPSEAVAERSRCHSQTNFTGFSAGRNSRRAQTSSW